MWLVKPPLYTIPTLVVHPEHITDRLRDGWVECADPNADQVEEEEVKTAEQAEAEPVTEEPPTPRAPRGRKR